MRALSAKPLKRFQRSETAASQLAPPRSTKRWRSASKAPRKADLRQQRAACAVGLGLRQAGGQVRLARFGAAGGRRRSPGRPASRSGRSSGGQRRGQRVRRIERQPERVVERGLRHIQVGGAVDALLRHGGQVHADGEHVDVGGHAGGAHRFGALQVGFGGAHGLLGGLQVFRRQDRAVVGARRLRR